MQCANRKDYLIVAAGIVLAFAMIASADFIEGPVKWSQPITVGGIPVDPQAPAPGVIDGQDWLSDHTVGVVRADDFTSDGREIVAVRWWGSYINEQTQRPDGFTGPFDISFHFSNGQPHPTSLPVDGTPLEFWMDVTAQEVFVGTDQRGDFVYRYDAPLPAPFPEDAGVEYFIDICKPTDENWGWHETTIQRQDFSARSPTHGGPWSSQGFDLAFELIAVPEPGTWALVGLGLMAVLFRSRRRR